MHTSEAYQLAQRALSDLKTAVAQLLDTVPEEGTGLTNSEIGRRLGIYHGHVGHEGHIPRTLLALLEKEGIVIQDSSSKRWRLRRSSSGREKDSPPLNAGRT